MKRREHEVTERLREADERHMVGYDVVTLYGAVASAQVLIPALEIVLSDVGWDADLGAWSARRTSVLSLVFRTLRIDFSASMQILLYPPG